VTLSIAGLTLGLRALFANFGGASPSFETGLVLILSGTTVSGITVRSETWVGARPGVECFGECKPASRLGAQHSTFAPVPSPVASSSDRLPAPGGEALHHRADARGDPQRPS
jgi:hypothetical protein